ncbi:MAG: methyl-accepting chemotaxis protein [Actinobacteria bacterium]|nr:methyl-accepting chemotaxis protein [Actinomycetota bacterium]
MTMRSTTRPSRPRTTGRITLSGRLFLLVAVGLLALVAMAAMASVASANQARAGARMARVSAAMSQEWNADMMHDGIRADVIAALYATTPELWKVLEVDGVTEHASEFVKHFTAAEAGAPESLRPEFQRVLPHVQQYARTASALVALAGKDRARAEAALPGFLELFGQLEEKLGAISEALLAAVQAEVRGAAAAAESARTMIVLVGLAATALFVLVGLWTRRTIRRSLQRMAAALRRVAGKDLTVRVEAESRDEVGEMAVSLNEAMEQIGSALRAAGESASTLTAASEELAGVSSRLGRSAEDVATEVGVVSTSSAEVSGSASAMSAAAEQMSASIQSVAGQATAAAQVASEAARTAQNTSAEMGRLNEASQEIGQIVKAITSIAEQTNLLALNATIEAARAGEAGKGFAVVATEVKDLAQETARATDDITGRISAIQELTGRTARAIDEITTVIGRINENQAAIATAVEQQASTTAEITQRVSEVTAGASQINTNIAGIAGATTSTSEGAEATQLSAARLAEVAVQVNSLIAEFAC